MILHVSMILGIRHWPFLLKWISHSISNTAERSSLMLKKAPIFDGELESGSTEENCGECGEYPINACSILVARAGRHSYQHRYISST